MNSSNKKPKHRINTENAGEIENPDGIGKAANPVYGDAIELRIRVKGDTITEASFKAFGCTEAVATCSIITEMIKNLKVEDAMQISAGAISDALGGLPPERIRCSVLAEQGLKNALEDYRKKRVQGSAS